MLTQLVFFLKLCQTNVRYKEEKLVLDRFLGVSLTASSCRQGQSGGVVSSLHNRLPPGLYNYLAQGRSLHCLASESNHQRKWPVALKRKNMNLIVDACLSFKPIAHMCENLIVVRRVCFEVIENVSGRLCMMKIREDSQPSIYQIFSGTNCR